MFGQFFGTRRHQSSCPLLGQQIVAVEVIDRRRFNGGPFCASLRPVRRRRDLAARRYRHLCPISAFAAARSPGPCPSSGLFSGKSAKKTSSFLGRGDIAAHSCRGQSVQATTRPGLRCRFRFRNLRPTSIRRGGKHFRAARLFRFQPPSGYFSRPQAGECPILGQRSHDDFQPRGDRTPGRRIFDDTKAASRPIWAQSGNRLRRPHHQRRRCCGKIIDPYRCRLQCRPAIQSHRTPCKHLSARKRDNRPFQHHSPCSSRKFEYQVALARSDLADAGRQERSPCRTSAKAAKIFRSAFQPAMTALSFGYWLSNQVASFCQYHGKPGPCTSSEQGLARAAIGLELAKSLYFPAGFFEEKACCPFRLSRGFSATRGRKDR